MRLPAVLLLTAATCSTVLAAAPRIPGGVTHEDIRDAILSLAHMFREGGNKLERHEYRERHLADELRRTLAGLEKRHKLGATAMDSIARAVSALDEKLDSVIQRLDKREEVERIQSEALERLEGNVSALGKMEQVLLQTADGVLDTRRRLEFGVQQILADVGESMRSHSKQMNDTVSGRFDAISQTILEHQSGALTNLTTTMETEISQVWRQIGIMYQQLTASAGALDKLQHQTETYVNGSLVTMDSMAGKVGQITGRMLEVDDNLNYLLGRLSLVTTEFKLIKDGLGSALENIRNSFLEVQNQMQGISNPVTSDPGPKPIPDHDMDDFGNGLQYE